MGYMENIERELGPISDAERALAERELDLLAEFTAGLTGRLPANATGAEQQQAITQLLHEDPGLAATFLEMIEISRSNPASPMASVARLEKQLREFDGD